MFKTINSTTINSLQRFPARLNESQQEAVLAVEENLAGTFLPLFNVQPGSCIGRIDGRDVPLIEITRGGYARLIDAEDGAWIPTPRQQRDAASKATLADRIAARERCADRLERSEVGLITNMGKHPFDPLDADPVDDWDNEGEGW